jgi:hypothetical protein
VPRLDCAELRARDEHLEELCQNKGLILQAATGFVVTFIRFTQFPDYWLRGASIHSIAAQRN